MIRICDDAGNVIARHEQQEGRILSDQIVFRDRLTTSVADRRLYESVKRRLAKEDWPNTNAYAHAKRR